MGRATVMAGVGNDTIMHRCEHVRHASCSSAMGAADQAVHVAFRALQSHEFRGEVVAMNGPLAAVANRAQLPLITAAEQAHRARVLALKNKSRVKYE